MLAAAAGLFLVTSCLAADATSVPAPCSGIETTVAGVKECLEPQRVFRECVTCPEMTVVPPGAFLMGSPLSEEHRNSAEGPQHPVEISHWLAVGKFEVTFAEWDACVAEGGCRHQPRDPGWGRGRRPAVNVSWDDVTADFLPWLSNKTRESYRLLTEAEWEYAARAGTSAAFSTGATITAAQANFDGTSSYAGSARGPYRQKTLEAGSFPANAFGLHDFHGNVWEWVGDCYTDGYQAASSTGEAGPAMQECMRVLRGGSWIDSPRVLRSAYRGRAPANARFIYRGFRIARTLK